MFVQLLTNHPVLSYKSPSDATLKVSCESFDCSKVVAVITRRSQGGLPNAPVVWRHTESGFKYSWLPYYKEEPENIANHIVNDLLKDYQTAKLAKLEKQPALTLRHYGPEHELRGALTVFLPPQDTAPA